MTTSPFSLSDLPDAEAQCQTLANLIRPNLTASTTLVGIYSGGAWVAERLTRLLEFSEPSGYIDVSFYRDDFAQKGLHPQLRPTKISFDVNDRRLILIDDVLYTGRTTRAAINELFDYGRPASIELAVLADRGGRQLPIASSYCAWKLDLPTDINLALEHIDNRLSWKVERHD